MTRTSIAGGSSHGSKARARLSSSFFVLHPQQKTAEPPKPHAPSGCSLSPMQDFNYHEEGLFYEKPLPNEPQGIPVPREVLRQAAEQQQKAQQEQVEAAATASASATSQQGGHVFRFLDRSRSHALFGRDGELEQLLELVEKSNSGARFARIHGPSGCGKTSLSLEFGRKLRGNKNSARKKMESPLPESSPSSSFVQKELEQNPIDVHVEQENEVDDGSETEFSLSIDRIASFVTQPSRSQATRRTKTVHIQEPTRQAVFISGKFDPFQVHVPYAAIVHAFDRLGHMLCDLQLELDPSLKHRIKEQEQQEQHHHRGDTAFSSPKPSRPRLSVTSPTQPSSSGHEQQSLAEVMDDDDLDAILELLTYEGKVLTQLVTSLATLVKRSNRSSLLEACSNSHFSCADLAGHRGDNSAGSLSVSARELSINATPGASNSNASREGSCLTERLILAFTSFLKTFCTTRRKLVWFLDDLQWADASSLRLLQTIFQDQEMHNLVVLIGYRDMVVPTSHKSNLNSLSQICMTPELQSFFEGLPYNRTLDVPLQNMDLDVVASWLAYVLKQATENPAFQLFTQVVHLKTGGNPYFVLQYLELLQRKKLLNYSFNTLKWDWNMTEIMNLATKHARNAQKRQQKQACADAEDAADATCSEDESSSPWLVSETVSQVVTLQIASMPATVQRLLQVASCLGFFFDAPLLESLSEHCDSLLLLGFSVANQSIWDDEVEENPQEESEYDEDEEGVSVYRKALEQAEAEGLIEPTADERIYKFTHDHIQKTIYEAMAQEKERALLHLRIGQHIKEFEDERFVLDAADQFNRGSSLLVYETERLDLIELNLKASSHAQKRAGIHLMADFLSKAIDIIQDRDWQKSYELVLEVYTRSAEAEFARGRFDIAQQRVDEIAKQSQSLDDELRARFVRMESYGAQRQYGLAIREARKLLAELGERIPSTNSVSLTLEYRRIRRLVQSKTDDDFNNLTPIIDDRRRWVVKVLQAAAVYGWRGDHSFAELAFMRLFRVTMTHGSCESTPFSYAGYGLIIAAMGNEIEGFRFGDLAIRQVKDKTSFPATTVLIHVYLSHLQRPAAESLEPLLSAYRIGLETGEVNFGSLAVCAYAGLYLFCGLPLNTYITDIRNFSCQLRLCGQDVSLGYILPMLQFALNMAGQTNDAYDLSWAACVQQHAFTEGVTFDTNSDAVVFIDYLQMLNAYMLYDLELAQEAAQRSHGKPLRGTHYANMLHVFIDGLVHIALYRRDKNKRYIRTANHAMSKLADLARKRSINCLGMLQLLKAEKASLKGGKHDGKKAYNEAISHLNRSGFIHFAAIANERAADFMELHSDAYWSEHYISEAAALYSKWGAFEKTRAMARRNSCIRLGDKSEVLNISLRGSTYFSGEFSESGTFDVDDTTKSVGFDDDAGIYGYGDSAYKKHITTSAAEFTSVRLLI